MKIKKLLIPLLIAGFVFHLTFLPALADQEKKEDQKEKSTQVVIPEKVKTALNQGIQSGETRQDITFQLIDYFYFLARQNMHTIFIFKTKNSNLEYTPVSPVIDAIVPATEEEAPPVEEAEAPTKLETNTTCYLQFHQLKDDTPGDIVKEIFIPVDFEVKKDSYEPNKEIFCTIGYPLPPGKYLLAMAIVSEDMEKIGTQYLEFSLPGPETFQDKLDTTSIFFVNKSKRISSPEIQPEVHKGYFTYSVMQIEPKFENVFHQGDNIELFFFVLGAGQDSQRKCDIEINYSVFQGKKEVIRYEKTTYNAPLIIQSLPPLKSIVIVKKPGEKEGKREVRDLKPGEYTFKMDIKDNISKKRVTKSIDFQVIE